MCDFDNPPFDVTPEFEAKIKRAIQDCNDGFTYEWLAEEDGHLGDRMKCNKCGQIGSLSEAYFPHKFDCPMRDKVTD